LCTTDKCTHTHAPFARRHAREDASSVSTRIQHAVPQTLRESSIGPAQRSD
jgi:hypothetical protein